MKIVCLLLSLMLNLSTAPSEYYARVVERNVGFYKSADQGTIMFELPASYFVKLIADCDEYYKAEYLGLSGYVKKDSVVPVVGTPKTPYLSEATFRVFSTDGAVMRVNPTKDSSIRCTLPVEQALTYVGSVVGDELISGRGNKWYYAIYTKNNETCTGYVYAGLCDMLVNVNQNTEQLSTTTNPFVSKSESYIKYLKQDNTFQTLLIVAVSLPAVALVYLLFKPVRLARGKKTNRQVDYYEDNDL